MGSGSSQPPLAQLSERTLHDVVHQQRELVHLIDEKKLDPSDQKEVAALVANAQREAAVRTRPLMVKIWRQYVKRPGGVMSKAEALVLVGDSLVEMKKLAPLLAHQLVSLACEATKSALRRHGKDGSGRGDKISGKDIEATAERFRELEIKSVAVLDKQFAELAADEQAVTEALLLKMDPNMSVTQELFLANFARASSEMFDVSALLGEVLATN